MIYISSFCVKHKHIKNSVEELVDNGFKNIELSGGTEYYDDLEKDLLYLKEKYNLNYLCHNYFPPPKEHFVLNLASLNNEVYNKTMTHLKSSIELSKKLGIPKFGFHAGFFIDIKVEEIGKKITYGNMFNKDVSIQRFCDGFNKLKSFAGSLKLYLENNAFSLTNAKTYKNKNIVMLTNYEEYQKLKTKINFELLLDIAHLKVSNNTQNLNFSVEFTNMINASNYIHISDNDALNDLNNGLQQDSDLIELLEKVDLKGKDFTIEVYDNMKHIIESYNILRGVYSD